jgi:hypothetical protein
VEVVLAAVEVLAAILQRLSQQGPPSGSWQQLLRVMKRNILMPCGVLADRSMTRSKRLLQ